VGFAFSDRYTIKFREEVYETDILTELWNVNLYTETGISNWNTCTVDLRKWGFFF